MENIDLGSKKLLIHRDDLRKIGITKSNVTLLRWEARGRFPRRIRMGGTSVCWLAADIQSWLEARAIERARHVYADYSN